MFGFKNIRQGFTIIEILIASLLMVVLSASIYKFLQSQSLSQIRSLGQMQSRTLATQTLDLFRSDVARVDPNWQKMGVASIFPHPGFGLGETETLKNYYIAGATSGNQLSDAVTIVKKHSTKHAIHEIEQALQDPDPAGPDFVALFGSTLTLRNPMQNPTDIERNDLVYVFEPGKFVMAFVDEVQHTGADTSLKLRIISDEFLQKIHTNQAGFGSGFVTKPGLVMGSYDYSPQPLTPDTGDDVIQFSANANLQVVEAVTWSLDFMTTDGKPKAASNTYVLNALAEKQPVVVRSEYSAKGIRREYMAKVEQLGFTYDLLIGKNSSGDEFIDGYTDGDIIRDVGREKGTNLTGFFQLSNVNPNEDTSSFIATANIVGARMLVSTAWDKQKNQFGLRNEVKVAIDPSFMDQRYQQSAYAQARGSENIHDQAELLGKEIVTKPLYFRNPHDDQDYVVMPVINANSDLGMLSEAGKLLVLDKDGNPVGGNNGVITLGDANNLFYPTQVNPITRGGHTYLVVSGMGMQLNGDQLQRVPMIATIGLSGGSMTEALASPGGSLCSIASCQLHVLDTQSVNTSMKDTSGGFFMHDGDLFVASMTKENPDQSAMKFFRTSLTGDVDGLALGDFTEVVVDSGTTVKDRVVSAVGNETMMFNDEPWIPVCLSRSIPCHRGPSEAEYEDVDPGLGAFLQKSKTIPSWLVKNIVGIQTCYADTDAEPCSASPEADGKIYMYPLSGGSPMLIAEHNYTCKSLQAVGDNLLVGGKLVTNVVNHQEMLDVFAGEPVVQLYTDEVVDLDDGVLQYADAFFPSLNGFAEDAVDFRDSADGQTYTHPISWNTGTSVHVFNDGTIGVALANLRLPHPSDLDTSVFTEQRFITMDVVPGGIHERVFSSIQTALANLSQSQVSNVYRQGEQMLSGEVVLPGNFWKNTKPGQTVGRTDVRELPFIHAEMNDAQWLDFFLDYHDPTDRVTGAPLTIPVPSAENFNDPCNDSIPASCTFN